MNILILQYNNMLEVDRSTGSCVWADRVCHAQSTGQINKHTSTAQSMYAMIDTAQ